MGNKGTPKTLDQAILNGMEDMGAWQDEKLANMIKMHVKDYLAQRFMAWAAKAAKQNLTEDQVIEMYRVITNK